MTNELAKTDINTMLAQDAGTTFCSIEINPNDRKSAANFSFLLSIPAILGGLVLELYKLVKEPDSINLTVGTAAAWILGMLVAAISGYFAVRFMIRLITKKGLLGFAIYTGALGLVVLILQLTKTLGFGFTPFGG